MMVVTLTVSSSFETKEAKAYDIVFRLNVKNKVKNKAAKVGKTILQLVATHKQLNKKKMNEQDYFYKKIKFRSQLHAGLEDFKNAKTLLGNYDATPEELLRQLTEKTGREFEEIKEILFSITATESQLEKLEKSQQEIMTALNECVLFTNTMQTNLIKHKKVLSSNSQ